jgi:hypothetical protein
VSTHKTERLGNIEVRLRDDGTLDEVLLYDDLGKGRVLFHMEQMALHAWWMRVIGSTRDLVVHIRSNTGDDESRAVADDMKLHGIELDGSRANASYKWD